MKKTSKVKNKKKPFKDLSRRFLVSFISICIIWAFLYFSENNFFKPFFILFLAILAAMATYEYTMLLKAKSYKVKSKLLITAAFFQVFSFGLYAQFIAFKVLPLATFAFFMLLFFLSHFNSIKGAISEISQSAFGIMYIAVPIGFFLPILYNSVGDGRIWILFLIIVTKITDVGGYFGGKILGRHKLASKISPNKTIEGAIVGIIFATLSSYFFYIFFDDHFQTYFAFRPMMFVFLGIVLGVLGQLGDLAESLLKRDADVKDSNKIPGLGGILDMFDSLLFNTVFIYFFLEVMI